MGERIGFRIGREGGWVIGGEGGWVGDRWGGWVSVRWMREAMKQVFFYKVLGLMKQV